MNELCKKTACELSSLLAQGETSSSELTKIYLDEIAVRGGEMNS
jgi:Asp-tRNA(Asn)/Glu-tRNA(Gln) amidotransferase A subunit family amidase